MTDRQADRQSQTDKEKDEGSAWHNQHFRQYVYFATWLLAFVKEITRVIQNRKSKHSMTIYYKMLRLFFQTITTPHPPQRWHTSRLQGYIVIFMNVSNEQGLSRKLLFSYNPCDVVVWFGSTSARNNKDIALQWQCCCQNGRVVGPFTILGHFVTVFLDITSNRLFQVNFSIRPLGSARSINLGHKFALAVNWLYTDAQRGAQVKVSRVWMKPSWYLLYQKTN